MAVDSCLVFGANRVVLKSKEIPSQHDTYVEKVPPKKNN